MAKRWPRALHASSSPILDILFPALLLMPPDRICASRPPLPFAPALLREPAEDCLLSLTPWIRQNARRLGG
ncbi:hypothetical protein HYDPIDRAFT_107166 [Hydnomerulius pinastri MD-312]|nr:hypothetical protein HYDPIDRAFT_107166 [Hydnomerulius pinastri MD-312]